MMIHTLSATLLTLCCGASLVASESVQVAAFTTTATTSWFGITTTLPDQAFSARASWRDHQPAEGRSNGAICWASAQSILGDWWQVDLGEIRTIEGIGLRGRASGDDQRVTSYTVSVSDDGHTWRVLRQSGTSPQDKAMVFPGAFIDRNTEVIANMPTSTTARFVRIYPQTWNQFMSMRCEIYVSEVRPIVKTDPDYDSF